MNTRQILLICGFIALHPLLIYGFMWALNLAFGGPGQ
jgi:hypothetical protein